MNKIIIGVIFLVISVYIYYKFFRNKYLLLKEPIYLGDGKTVVINNNNLIKKPVYTFSFWFKINNVGQEGYWKSNTDFPRLLINNNGSPDVLYYINSNKLRVQICYQGSKNILNYYNFDLENIEQQRWNNVVITVNSDIVQIYKNGKKIYSIILNNPNIVNLRNMIIGSKKDNFNGYIANVYNYDYIMNKNEILKNYNKILKTY